MYLDIEMYTNPQPLNYQKKSVLNPGTNEQSGRQYLAEADQLNSRLLNRPNKTT